MRIDHGYPPRNTRHLLQLYGRDEASLISNVTAFVSDALQVCGYGIVIAVDGRLRSIREALGDSDRVTFLDAREALSTFMVGGQPNRSLFDTNIGSKVRALSARGKLHAYGEMVGWLWSLGMREAALQLEEFWNELLERAPFSLYCGYALEANSDDPMLSHIISAHSECIEGLRTA